MDDEKIEKAADHESPVVITVFIAQPLTKKPITDPRPGDTPEEVAERQAYLDIVSGFDKSKK